jgi:catechol 2,3-dioxygenase-like lactoylglutathione lyase family enzyme
VRASARRYDELKGGQGETPKAPRVARGHGSLDPVIDHVTIRVPELEEGTRFYGRALALLGADAPAEGGGFVDWGDFSLTEQSAGHPPTRRLHVAFYAESPALVTSWWQEMTAAGYEDAGAPGPRPYYGPEYHGAFVLDAAGNSVEAVHDGARRQAGVLDHLWLRVADLEAATRFYEAVCPAVDHRVERHPGRSQVRGPGATFALVPGEPSEGVHLAFAAPDRLTVDAFHRAGVDAGYASNGAPGERPDYHPGYYAAFLLDPDGTNVEAVFHGRP